MARDSQAALVALNRFGGRARRGVRRFLNAASDPRGFVKGELARPNGVLLEVPGLQSTPALGKAVFDYQFVPAKRRGEGAREWCLLLRNLIHLRHLFCAQAPADRFHVLLDLLDAGGAGDDAGDLRAGG